MSHIKVDYFALEELRKNPICGKGSEGISYFLDSKTILKLYKYLYLKRKLYFEEMKSELIAFPIDIYEYENSGFITGYTSKFCRGINLEQGFKETILIDNLVKAYNMARDEIIKYEDIKMEDMAGVNLIYNEDDNKINFIDTSRWFEEKKSLDYNLKRFDSIVFYNFVISIGKNFRNLNFKLKPLYERAIYKIDNNDNMLFLEFLNEYQKEIDNENYKGKTIGDLRKKS